MERVPIFRTRYIASNTPPQQIIAPELICKDLGNMKTKIAIIGASYLQKPLVVKAKDMGLETHVFAWEESAVCKQVADYYYPISVLDRERILEVCMAQQISGVISIASDIVMPTVNYIIEKMGLIGNSMQSTLISTDKYEMRKALTANGIECPSFEVYDISNFRNDHKLRFPVIVKPTDRSGSLSVTKVNDLDSANPAIAKALSVSLSKRAIVEEFVKGREFSVEMISYQGVHYPLTVTDKVTSGEPYYVELEHHQPAEILPETRDLIYSKVLRALDALQIRYGASHTEVILTPNDGIMIVEVAGRMGGDFIGSDLVELSTGYDFLRAVINISIGQFEKPIIRHTAYSGVYFLSKERELLLNLIRDKSSAAIVKAEIFDPVLRAVQCSGDRNGYLLYKGSRKLVTAYTEGSKQ